MSVTVVAFPMSVLSKDPETARKITEYGEKYGTTYTSQHELVGKKIWRRVVELPDDTIVPAEAVFEKHQGQPIVFRAQAANGFYSVEPKFQFQRGLVCYCFDPIPKNWTYFLITKMHVAGKTAVVRPVVGRKHVLFRQWNNS